MSVIASMAIPTLNRPFIDGNTRGAWIACVTFLALNGYPLPKSALEPPAEQLIAQHEVSDRSQADRMLADWLGARLRS